MTGEDYFPRGRNEKRPRSSPQERRFNADTYNLFDTLGHKPRNVRNTGSEPKEKEVVTNESEQSQMRLDGTLEYNKLRDDLTIICCVRRIYDHMLEVELPSLLFGDVNLNAISHILSSSLDSDEKEPLNCLLRNRFQIGQVACVQIQNVERSEDNCRAVCSMDPAVINANKNHKSFNLGMLVWACIASELDHGYQISLGVNNCRAFLPFSNVDPGQHYMRGQPLFCKITKLDVNDAASTLILSALIEQLNKPELHDSVNLNDILPGTCVHMDVERVLKHGIEGKCFTDYVSFLDRTQIKSTSKLKNLIVGSSITANIMYVDGLSKVMYLTLMPLKFVLTPPSALQRGDIVSGQIQFHYKKGIQLKLMNNCGYGIMVNKRLIRCLNNKPDMDVNEELKKAFPTGTYHKCRILDYMYVEGVYVCSFEKALLTDQIFNMSDLKVGQVVKGKINSVLEKGFLVRLGQIIGFVPMLHASDMPISKRILLRLREGFNVTTRVLSISENKLILTLKPSLVNASRVLDTLKANSIDQRYKGMVFQTSPKGAMVSFFNDISGWLPTEHLTLDATNADIDPRQFFFLGQVVEVYVQNIKDDKLYLSMFPPNMYDKQVLLARAANHKIQDKNVPWNNNAPYDVPNIDASMWPVAESEQLPSDETFRKQNIKLPVGFKCSGVVTSLTNDGVWVHVSTKKGECDGFIPKNHLSSSVTLCTLALESINPGDKLTHLICIKRAGTPILSKRERLFKTYSLDELIVGMHLRCSFLQQTNESVIVTCAIKDYEDDIVIPAVKCDEYQPYQCIIAKVLSVQLSPPCLELDLDLRHLLNEPIKYGVLALRHYLADYDSLFHKVCSSDLPVMRLQPGQMVKGYVKEVLKGGKIMAKLKGGITAYIPRSLSPHKLKPNDKIEGTVFFVSLKKMAAYVSLLKIAIAENNLPYPSKPLRSTVRVQRLLQTDDVLIGLLSGKQPKRLVYMPTKFYDHDSSNSLKALYARRKIHGVVWDFVCNKYLVAIPRKYALKDPDYRSQRGAKKPITAKPSIKLERAIKVEPCEFLETSFVDLVQIKEEVKSEPETDSEHLNTPEPISDFTHIEEVTSSIKDDEMSSTPTPEESAAPCADLKQSSPVKKSIYSNISSFSTAHSDSENQASSSSEDEEDENEPKAKRKKIKTDIKINHVAAVEYGNDNMLYKSEYYDSVNFEQLVRSQPNNSDVWIKYMNKFIVCLDYDAAREVGRRALETINMEAIRDKFRVWAHLLYIENMVGDTESFNKLFNEAAKCNDTLDIFLHAIQLLGRSGKFDEMDSKIRRLKHVERCNIKMWLEVARIYYTLMKFPEARQLKAQALKAIPEPRAQFDLIVRFAVLEFQLGELDQAIANFDILVDTYPTKVNIWIIYVDQLIKQNAIENARIVLERATCLKLNLKSMKSIFQKFVRFEEQFGGPVNVEKVKKLACEYLKTVPT